MKGRIIHLRWRKIAACEKWSASLTDDPRLVTCPDCKDTWQYATAAAEFGMPVKEYRP